MINLQICGTDDAKMHIEVPVGIYDTIFGITQHSTVAKSRVLTKDEMNEFIKVGLCCSITADRIFYSSIMEVCNLVQILPLRYTKVGFRQIDAYSSANSSKRHRLLFSAAKLNRTIC
jgi:hypothetical protein